MKQNESTLHLIPSVHFTCSTFELTFVTSHLVDKLIYAQMLFHQCSMYRQNSWGQHIVFTIACGSLGIDAL